MALSVMAEMAIREAVADGRMTETDAAELRYGVSRQKKLLLLIERLELATEDDVRYRAGYLNADIATALWGEPTASGSIQGPRTLHWLDGGIGRSVAPDFVNSVDAAMLTMPKGKWFLLCSGKETEDEKLWGAAVHEPVVGSSIEVIAMGEHDANPAIALCIACLKARAIL